MNAKLKIIRLIKATFSVFFLFIMVVPFFLTKAEYVEGTGTVIPNITCNIYSPISGTIDKVFKDFGNNVKKNDIIMRIDGRDKEDELMGCEMQLHNITMNIDEKNAQIQDLLKEENECERNVERVKLEIKDLSNEYQKTRFLVSIGIKPRYELDKCSLELEKKKNELISLDNNSFLLKIELINKEKESLEKQKKLISTKCTLIKSDLNKRFIRSPENNLTIITKENRLIEGAYVNKGTLLCVLACINKLKMIVVLDESEIGKVRIGQKAKIFLDSIPYEKLSTLEGKVTHLYPQAVGDTITYNQVELTINGFTHRLKKDKLDQVNLKNGLKGKARIMVKQKKKLIDYLREKMFE